MLKKILSLIILCLFFSACENTTEVSTQVPYQEYIVVNAELQAFTVFQGVRITHTLPLDVPFDITKAEITNAVAYILEDGIRIIPIHYTSNGLYNPIGDLIIRAGSQYELFASINSKNIYSKTIVPGLPEIDNVSNVDNSYLTAQVVTRPGEAYGAAWIITTGVNSFKADDFFSIETADQYPSDISVRTQDIPPPYNTPAFSDKMFIQIYAFDKAYKDYFITRTNNEPINNTFTSGGGILAWNVYGDHVIGLFMGMTEGHAVRP
jgi:hypothetical protein